MPQVPDNANLLQMRILAGKSYREDAKVSRFAASQRILYLASFAASSGVVKSIKATLQDPAMLRSTSIRVSHADGVGRNDLTPASEGYTWHIQPLGYRMVHAVIAVRSPRFLCPFSDQTLWKLLSSPTFNVPILKEWIPFVRKKLEIGGYLDNLSSYQCDARYITASDRHVGDIVQAGVKSGHLAIPD